jgi:hypothetical protein
MSEDRLTQKDIALAKARMKYIAANKNKKKTQDRLTQEDVDLAEARMPYLEANQDKTQDRLTQTDIARAKARMPYLAANKRYGGAIIKAAEGEGIETAKKHKAKIKDTLGTAKGYVKEFLGFESPEDRRNRVLKSLIIKKDGKAADIYVRAQKEKGMDRVTQKDIEIYQNDRTQPLPKKAYEQADQELTYEEKAKGGMMNCKGGRKAIGGTKFTGVK